MFIEHSLEAKHPFTPSNKPQDICHCYYYRHSHFTDGETEVQREVDLTKVHSVDEAKTWTQQHEFRARVLVHDTMLDLSSLPTLSLETFP